MRRLVYVTGSRLPTEKAHGYQICKMCEAFAQQGVDVMLAHPRRRQADRRLAEATVYDFYGIHPDFEVLTLPNLDVIPAERWVPRPLFAALFEAHATLWGLFAAGTLSRTRDCLFYTRDPHVLYWCLRLRLPSVYEAHDVPRAWRLRLLRRAARSPALRLAVAITGFIAKALVEVGFPPDKVMVQPDGVDLSLFEGLPSKEECRRRLGLPQGPFIFGYVGRFLTMGQDKGIPNVIRALAHLRRESGADVLFLAVGGPMEVVPQYLALAGSLGLEEERVMFVDRVPTTQVPLWIRAFDVAVAAFPWTEHYAYFMSPLKIFEYMAAGVPILATDLPSLREVLRHGQNAWLVAPGDPGELSEGMARLLSDRELAGKLAAQAQADAARYTWRQRAARILAGVSSP